MTGVTPQVIVSGLPDRPLNIGDTLILGEGLSQGALTTVGAGTITGAMIASGIVVRTGPTGGFTDTTDSAANILAALAGNFPAAPLNPGSSFRLLYINTVAETQTLAAGTGVTLGTDGSGVNSVAASSVREYLVRITNAMTPVTIQCNTTNSSAVVTFVLPAGVVALNEGPRGNPPQAGCSVSGTNISAGTTVLGVTQGVGGVTGVTLSANATGTTASGGTPLTFGPAITISGLRSDSL